MLLNGTRYMRVYLNKHNFKVILGNACVAGENVVPTGSPDNSWLILKTVF